MRLVSDAGDCVKQNLWLTIPDTSVEYRRCPGTHLVESSAWLLMASTIAAFDLSKAKDGQGNIVDPIVRFEDSVFRSVHS